MLSLTVISASARTVLSTTVIPDEISRSVSVRNLDRMPVRHTPAFVRIGEKHVQTIVRKNDLLVRKSVPRALIFDRIGRNLNRSIVPRLVHSVQCVLNVLNVRIGWNVLPVLNALTVPNAPTGWNVARNPVEKVVSNVRTNVSSVVPSGNFIARCRYGFIDIIQLVVERIIADLANSLESI